ncbi:hypothetical protein BC938DRAFT_481034 [Jimgerdemannia flammicorona]|uniref:Uncharacterized protein n=1 Tax=Jimgerdemannia flammicorona TaxID=994334 RepID=A0A433QH47_9FUNG|nr:hypothetical protein BC938DRAFT_481034 [Jimgerdemannia flammicorona]
MKPLYYSIIGASNLDTNELGPALHFARDHALGGFDIDPLPHAGIHKQPPHLGVIDQRDTEVDRGPSDHVAVVLGPGRANLGEVDDEVNLVVKEQGLQGLLVAVVGGDGQGCGGHAGLLKEAGGIRVVSENGVAEVGMQPAGDVDEVVLVRHGVVAQQDTGTALGDAEVLGGLDRGPEGLLLVDAEARHLTRRGHLDAQEGIGALQARPRELRNLDGLVGVVLGHEILRRRNVGVGEGTGGHVDEVGTEDLGDEGEGAGGAQVAFNDLELGGLAGVGLFDNLHVERPRNLERRGDLFGDALEPGHGLLVEITRRQYEYGVHEQLALVRDGIDVDLLRVLDELCDNDRVQRRHVGGLGEVVLENLGGVRDVHGGAGEHVRRADEDWVANLVGKLVSLLNGCELLPRGLVDADPVEDARELVPILGGVNHLWVCAQHIHLVLRQAEGDVLRELPTDADHHTFGLLLFVDIHHAFEAQFLKRPDARHTAPIEFHRRSNAIHARAQHHSSLIIEGDIIFRGVVGRVEVIGVGGEFCRKRIDSLDEWHDASLLPGLTNSFLSAARQFGDLYVGETGLLGLVEQVGGDGFGGAVLERAVNLGNVFELV